MDIEIKDLSVSYPSPKGPVRVLRHADLHLPSGKITALVGESGSGKSILGAAIVGLLEPAAEISGTISFDGRDLCTLDEEALNTIRGERIGWLAQDPIAAMNPLMRVGKQVTELVRYRDKTSEAGERARGIRQLGAYGLSEPAVVYQKYPRELSGGMAQRVLTAAVTLPCPEWIIADEPTKGLDAFVRREVCERFRRLRDEEGIGFLLITHDLRLATRLSDYIGIMYAGEILEYGETRDIFAHPGHPYTQGLFAAQPHAGLHPIPGLPPDLSALPKGCVFGPRCARYEAGICRSVQCMRQIGKEHALRCGKGGQP